MNISLPQNPLTSGNVGTQALHKELSEIKQLASQSIEKALTLFGTVNSGGTKVNENGSLTLVPPKSILTSVGDLTLRIALMQDALDQLMQEVSKNEIQQRLNDLNRENQEHLAKIKEQMKEVEKSAQKAREAAQKTNIFKAIANFFKALVDFIVGVFTAIAAIGYALTGNVVAAAHKVLSAKECIGKECDHRDENRCIGQNVAILCKHRCRLLCSHWLNPLR
jgi:hypothetical protein